LAQICIVAATVASTEYSHDATVVTTVAAIVARRMHRVFIM